MTEKGDEGARSSQNLVCPLCLEIYEDATILTCGHTFCRKCLRTYDASRQDVANVVCPVCRRTNELTDARVEGLPSNVSVNELVDDYHNEYGGENDILEFRPECTMCKLNERASYFCSECKTYMCDRCSTSHDQLSRFFEGHVVSSVDDSLSGNASIYDFTEKCLVHKLENKDLFCKECKVHICSKCVIVNHRNHEIINQSDFETQLKRKIEELTLRCNAKKTEIEKNIQDIEMRRKEVHCSIQRLQSDVSEAYNKKARQLEENERTLSNEIQSLQRGFDKDLDALKAKCRQRVKSMMCTESLVANDKLGQLEADSLTAHNSLCDELDGLLIATTDTTSAKDICETAGLESFFPADDGVIELGKVAKFFPNDPGKEKINDELLNLEKLSNDRPHGRNRANNDLHAKSEDANERQCDLKKVESGDLNDLGKATNTRTGPHDSGKVRNGGVLNIDKVANPYVHVVKELDVSSHSIEIATDTEDNVAVALNYRERGVDIINGDLEKARNNDSHDVGKEATEGRHDLEEVAHDDVHEPEEVENDCTNDPEDAADNNMYDLDQETNDGLHDHGKIYTACSYDHEEANDGVHDKGKVVREGLIDINNIANAYVHVLMEVDLPSHTYGIAKKGSDSVAVTLSDHVRVDIIDCIGSTETLSGLPSRSYFDIAIHCNGNMVISHDSRSEIDIHAADGQKLFSIPIQSGKYRFRLSVGPSNEIIVATGSNKVYIYDPSGKYLKCTVPTEKNLSRQALVTKSGVVVSSSCDLGLLSVLTVYDKDGRAGSSLTGNHDEYLYAAADDQDIIYVATVNKGMGKVSIALYELDHLNLIEKHRFEEIKLCIRDKRCYLVSLNPSMLVFACYEKLYFIGVKKQ